jgi:hypothetical protein
VPCKELGFLCECQNDLAHNNQVLIKRVTITDNVAREHGTVAVFADSIRAFMDIEIITHAVACAMTVVHLVLPQLLISFRENFYSSAGQNIHFCATDLVLFGPN